MQDKQLLPLFWALLAATPAFSRYYSGASTPVPQLSVAYQWKFLEFQYKSMEKKQEDLISGNLIPRRPAPIDVDVYYNRRNGRRTVFVTSPKWQAGTPASLSTVVVEENNTPLLRPYPSWEWHTEPTKCKKDRIVSVFRIMVDECERLWVLDDGQLDADVICPPQILAFDLKTNQLIHRYEIPDTQYEPRSTFVTVVVDILSRQNECLDTFLYLADCAAYSIVVYDLKSSTSWKTQHASMYPDPDFGTYNVAGETFQIMDGVMGLALTPDRQNRKLFYHAMSSSTEHWAYTSDLRNQSLFANNPAGSKQVFYTFKGRRNTQSAAQSIDKNGVMFFGMIGDITIDCFNTQGDYGKNSNSTDTVADNKDTLQFPSGIKIKTNLQGREELWIMTSRYQKVANDNIKDSEFNFRILVGDVEALKQGTKCLNKIRPSGATYENNMAIYFPSDRKR